MRDGNLGNMARFMMLSALFAGGAWAGDGTRGGGDPQLISEFEYQLVLKSEYGGDLKAFIERSLKKELKHYLKAIDGEAENFTEISENPVFKATLIRLRRLGLDADIEKTPAYSVRSNCTNDKGETKGASTLNGVRSAEVCFDPEVLRLRRTTLSQLVGLAFHEHARHLGTPDESHELAYAVASSFKTVTAKRASYAYCTLSPYTEVWVWEPNRKLQGPAKDPWAIPSRRPENQYYELGDGYFIHLSSRDPGRDPCDPDDAEAATRDSATVTLEVRKRGSRASAEQGYFASLVSSVTTNLGSRSRNYPFLVSLVLGDLNMKITCENK